MAESGPQQAERVLRLLKAGNTGVLELSGLIDALTLDLVSGYAGLCTVTRRFGPGVKDTSKVVCCAGGSVGRFSAGSRPDLHVSPGSPHGLFLDGAGPLIMNCTSASTSASAAVLVVRYMD